jgi:hypothetical protein
MTAMSSKEAPFVAQVSAVSPLDGDAIDGSARKKPRKSPSAPDRPTVTVGRRCPICRESFYDIESFGQHVWDETPSHFEDAANEREFGRQVYRQWDADAQELRDQIRVQLGNRPDQTLPELAVACGKWNEVGRSAVRRELGLLVECGVLLRRSRIDDHGLRRIRYSLVKPIRQAACDGA